MSVAEKIAFTAFGVALELSVPPGLEARVRQLLPPAVAPPGEPAARLSLDHHNGQLLVSTDGETVGASADEDVAIGLLDAQIRARVALLAPEHVFVHAGAVAVEGRVVVLPGFTHSGKTTLTRALVEAGATYYSDEFAVIDRAGLIHPYPKPLSIRHSDGSGRTTETPAAALGGGATGTDPAPLGLVAVTRYRPGATLDPRTLGAGAALLALLGHTIPARTRPQQSLSALKAAVQGARAWESERGEASEAARAIMAAFSARRHE